jgi:hypothetical protein
MDLRDRREFDRQKMEAVGSRNLGDEAGRQRRRSPRLRSRLASAGRLPRGHRASGSILMLKARNRIVAVLPSFHRRADIDLPAGEIGRLLMSGRASVYMLRQSRATT